MPSPKEPNMDFDYQRLKDEEDKQREERVRALPIPALPVPVGGQDPSSSVSRKPPVKPRRSIKCRPVSQQEAVPSSNLTASHTGSEVVVKRLSPAVMLGPSGPLEALSPSLRAHTLLWFHRSQLPRLQTQGQPLPRWLHGFATRREAEQLLHDQPLGCFLLRLSESKIGFVLSYRGKDRCRHFIVEEEEDGHHVGQGGKYVITGESSRHCSLEDLINYYTHNPVGPFDEMLTVPYTKTSGLSDDIIRKRVGVLEQVNDVCGQNALVSPSPDPASMGGETVSKETPEYAVVRKALRKSRSLPESPNGPDTAPPIAVPAFSPPSQMKETPVCPVNRPSSEASTSAPSNPVDAPYAQVNKPLRGAAQTQTQTQAFTPGSSASGLQGATTPLTAEQKYWHLEPEHTYEETPGNQEHIDFYAVGRRREVEQTDGDSRNHVYSEVNIHGARPGLTTSSPEPAPIRQQSRLPLRPNIACSRPDSGAMQNFSGGLLSTSPSRSGDISPYSTSRHAAATDPSPIYEQIPARASGPRPPLPPPNPRQ